MIRKKERKKPFQFMLKSSIRKLLDEIAERHSTSTEKYSASSILAEIIEEEYKRKYCHICGREAEKEIENEWYCYTCSKEK